MVLTLHRPTSERLADWRAGGRHPRSSSDRRRHEASAVVDPASSTALDAYLRAANYLAAGQIYLLDNPLLQRAAVDRATSSPASSAIGHGSGLNLIYAHLNRASPRDLDAIYVCGPGHGGPAHGRQRLARGDLQRAFPTRTGMQGMARLFRQFSFPGGIPSHAAPRRPGRSTKVVSSATRSATRTARPSTTPTSSWPASSETARPNGPGDQLALQQIYRPRRQTGRSLPDPASERLQDRRADDLRPHPGAARACSRCSPGYGYRPILVEGGFDGEPSSEKGAPTARARSRRVGPP